MNQSFVTQTVAARVRGLRRKAGWSAAKLADEMTEAGFPWGRVVVSKLERGDRESISVDELFGLAYVFSVAPVHLLVPIESDDDAPYEIVPGQSVPRSNARDWIRGRRAIGDPRIFVREMPEAERAPDKDGNMLWVVSEVEIRDAWEKAKRTAADRDGKAGDNGDR